MGDKYAVVGDRNAGFSCALDAVVHLAAVQHTGSAVYDHAVGCKIGGIRSAAGKFEFYVPTGMLTNPPWKLDGADIIALAMMGINVPIRIILTWRR